MLITNANRWSASICLAIAVAIAPALAGAEPAAPVNKTQEQKARAETVDVFAAIKAGLIEVKYIAKNANQANLVVTNKTKRPLNVELPEAFAGMPVLAQLDAGDNQGVGGGIGGGGGFNIAPEKIRRVKVRTLCLEHGKADPNPRVVYEIRPIKDLTSKPEVIALVARYAQGDINIKAAQAAAWHLENGLSWAELAAKQVKHLRGPNNPYFTRGELAGAMTLAKAAIARAKELGGSDSLSGDSDSLSPGVVD